MAKKRFPLVKLLLVLLAALPLTGCSLLPMLVANGVADGGATGAASDTVTISRAEYERLQRYREMDDILQIAQEYYYQEPDVDAMIENASRGLLYGLEDPYTFYYNPEEYKEMWADDEGNYAGIGIQILGSYETYLCTITRVFAGSPAQAAGLHKGDILSKVEDLDVTAYTLTEAVNIMRGQVGEVVKIEVQRGKETLSFDIPRAEIVVDRVASAMLTDDVGLVAFYEFAGDCATEFRNQVDALLRQGMKAMILDLRDNPGGWVDAAVHVADVFLPVAKDVYYLEDRYGAREYAKTTGDEALNIPLVVLVNENSASSSEILAGALKDYGVAKIVGVTTFGKGVVQYVLPVGTKGAGLQITAAQYFTPNGNAVHKIGIAPDVEAKLPEGDTTYYELGDLADAQLTTALDVARDLLAGGDGVPDAAEAAPTAEPTAVPDTAAEAPAA